MGDVLVFTEEHLNTVAELEMRVMRGDRSGAKPSLIQYFRDIFLDNPWATPDIPPLVYVDHGKVVGFLGIVPRPMTFQGKPIRVGVTSQFMIDREHHRGNGAFQLLGKFLNGPQDLSFADGVGDAAYIVWAACGADAARLYSSNWFRMLRPFGSVQAVMKRAGGAGRKIANAAAPLFRAGDAIASHFKIPLCPLPASKLVARVVSPQQLWECIDKIGWRQQSLTPAYELASFQWLIDQVSNAKRAGTLRLVTVEGEAGRCGWFVYYCRFGDPAILMQIGVRRRDQFDAVFRAFLRDAWAQGASMARGQAIPQFLTNLTDQHCLFRHPGSSVLIHSRRPELLQAIHKGDAALSRLDGECWMRFTSEDWR